MKIPEFADERVGQDLRHTSTHRYILKWYSHTKLSLLTVLCGAVMTAVSLRLAYITKVDMPSNNQVNPIYAVTQ